MTSDVKKKLRQSINMFIIIALIFVSIPAGQASVSANRAIEDSVLTAGNSTNVTVTIQNDITQALSLMETIPSGWVLTRGTDDADQFKASTNEWVWLTAASNTVKTVKYKVTVPSGTAPGIYDVSGETTTSAATATVAGDKTIEVTGTTVTDKIAPTTALSGVIEGGKYVDNATIVLTATDNTGGSGVKNTTFSLNGAAMSTYSTPIVVTKIGQNTVTYSSADNSGNVEKIKKVNFTINNNMQTGSFGFTVTPLSATINVGETAKYNLTLTNTGSAEDTYNLVADKQNGKTTATLEKNSVTVGQGNSAVVGLTVTGSAAGIFTVNVRATSKADVKNNNTVAVTTNVIVPALAIENLASIPNSAISNTNPAKLSANVKKGIFDIVKVEFGIVDSNNLLGKGIDTILAISRNVSGAEGLYKTEGWPASYTTIGGISGNVAVTDIVTTIVGDVSGSARIRGIFKASNTGNGTDAVLSFNGTTGNMSNVTDFATGKLLTIQNAKSTFQSRTSKFTSGNVVPGDISTKAFTLYNVTGNVAVNNPSIEVKMVPNGNYKVYATANDTNGSVYQLIDINTIPASAGGGSSGGSSSTGGGSGDGTYPSVTSTPRQNATATPAGTEVGTPVPTVTVTVAEPTTARPVETTAQEVPIEPVATKKSPGIGIVAIIGIIGAIYIVRRRK